MVKIAVGGCSFSDFRYGLIPWGKIVADHFGVDYIHEAACAGSNQRIWRRLTAHVLNGNLIAGDIIILQYTLVDRKESWTPELHTNYDLECISEHYDNGTLVRLTPHFEQFAISRHERQLAHTYNYFNNHNLNLEQFWTQHHGFSALCENKGIHLRYLNTVYDCENRIKDINGTSLLDDPAHCLDSSHLNQLGHNQAAQLVIQSLSPTIVPN